MSFFEYNGKKIYYEEHGCGEALILHPAMMSNMEDFISVCEEFFAGITRGKYYGV